MDTYTGFVKNSAVSVAHRILWKSRNWLQAITVAYRTCKDQSQAVSEAFTQRISCLHKEALPHCCGPVHASPRTWRHSRDWQAMKKIDEQWKNQRVMVINEKTKGLITPPPRWVSAQLLYVGVSAWRWSWQWSWQCSWNLRRPFLRAVRFL